MGLSRQQVAERILAVSVAANLFIYIYNFSPLWSSTPGTRISLEGRLSSGGPGAQWAAQQLGPPSNASLPLESTDGSTESRSQRTTTAAPTNAGGKLSSVPTSREALRELEDWTSFPGPDVCGNWADSYKERHRQMLAREIEGRWVTLEQFQAGLGDHLMGILTTFVAALVSNRTFLMLPSILDLGFEPAEVDWRVPDFVSANATTILRQEIRENGTVFKLRRLNGWNADQGLVSFPADTLEYFQLLRNATNVLVVTNGGILSHIYHKRGATFQALHRLGLRLPFAVGCILRFLIKPKREVLELTSKPYAELRAGNASSVCMHFRTSDGFAFEQSKETAAKQLSIVDEMAEAALVCARRLSETWLPSRTPTRWLFLSDSAALVSSLQKKYPGKVMGSPAAPLHISLSKEKALLTVVVDWLLLSTCDFSIITQSGFSKSATAYSIRNPYRFLLPIRWDFNLFRRKDVVKCRGDKPHTLLDFRWWSGL